MIRNYAFGDINQALPVLMRDLVHDGHEFGSRGGRTLELMHFGITLTHPWRREIVLPSRKANIAAQIVETMWVLAGRNDIATLAPYLPRAVDFSDDGLSWRAGYGPRLRKWGTDFETNPAYFVDQLDYVVETLRKSSGSRQAVATLWDPMTDTLPGKDIACNNWLSFSSRLGKLDLHVGIRSNDAMWGWSGINAFEWSALQEIVAGMLGLYVGGLHFSITSFHLYQQHWDKARQIAEDHGNFKFADSPRFNAEGLDDVASLDELCREWFDIECRIRAGESGVMKDVDNFPEPMLKSWLRVLQWYWSAGEQVYIDQLVGTRLHEACKVGLLPGQVPAPLVHTAQAQLDDHFNTSPAPRSQTFQDHVNALHTEKHAAYGDSWKRRGEKGILGNIARKIDRLESGLDTTDETQTDTAIDLLVYLAKYRCWLDDREGGPGEVAVLLSRFEGLTLPGDPTKELVADFEALDDAEDWARPRIVDDMLPKAYGLARSRWS